MSEQTWMDEFYPIDACDVPADKAIKHSLVKWLGLRKKSLKKHGLEYPPIEVSGNTCSLCQYHNNGITPLCSGCPLKEYLGRPCSSWLHKYEYEKYKDYGNPEPMIAALEAIEFVERTCK